MSKKKNFIHKGNKTYVLVELDKEQVELVKSKLKEEPDFENAEHLIRTATDLYCLDHKKDKVKLTNEEIEVLIDLVRKMYFKYPSETRFFNLKVKLEKMKGE